jgi:arsenate reductase-like glutaredoxin family protein
MSGKTATSIDWSYHRNGCKTCGKTQDFLAKHKLAQPKTVVDARKNKIGIKEALKLAHSMNKLYVAKGSKVIFYDMKKDSPDNDTLESLLIGPTGNLRAPTLQVGKTLLVGFDNETYSEILCS